MAEGGGTARTLQGRLWDLPFGLLHLYTDALGRVWRLTMDGVGAAEHLASAAFGAAIGGSQGFVIACVRLLPFKPTPPPVVRRLLPSLPLLVGSTAEAEGRTGGPAEQAEVQVIGMGAGYTLNVASAEAAPEPPSPQFVPSARAEGELGVEAAGGVPAGKAEFIRRKEEGIGTAAPRAPQTPEAASCFFQQPLDLTSFCRQPLEHTSPSGHPTYRLSSRVLTCRRQPVVHGFARCSQLQGAMPCRRLTHAPCPAFTGRTHAAKPWLASLLAERPGLTEAPHAFGERYVGHEVEPLGTELQGPEEPSLPAAGGAVNGPSRAGEGVAAAVSPRRARLEAMFRETQDLRAHTTETLRKAEQLPGRVEGEATGPGALEEAALPVAVAGGAAAGAAAAGPPRLERITPPLEPMPADMISGEEGRAASPALEALPEGSEEGTPHAGLKRPPSLPLEAQAVEQPAAGEAPGAEARLRGLFAPVPVLIPVPGGGAARMAPPGMPAEGGAAGAAPGPAATGAVTGYEPGSTGLLGGRQGERVVVQRMMLPGMGAAEAELPAERVSKGEEGAAVAETAATAPAAGAVPAAGAELEGAGLAGEAPAGEALEAAPEEVPPAAAAAEAPGEATPGPPAAEGVEQAAGRVPAAGEEPLAVEEPAAAAAKELAAEEERAPEAKLMGPEPEVPAGEVPPPVEKEPSLAAAPPTPARPSEVAAAEPGTSAFAAPAAAEAKPPVPPAAASKAAPAVPAAPAAAAATAPTAGAPVKKKKKGRGPLHKVAKEFRKIFFTPPS